MTGGMFGEIENPQYKEYIRDIYRSSNHLLSLINDILDLSKIEANKMELADEDLDLGEEVRGCERLIRWRAQEAKLVFDVLIAEDLPRLIADRRALRQMILNLVSNAVKFTPEGGRVVLSVEREVDGRIAISVADTGIGIEKSDIPKALTPFQQISTGDTVYMADGTGLGLPITAALARLHGGTVVIRSEPGRGTEVTVRLPASRLQERPVKNKIEFV
jgi:Amt family ammonium transporter